VIDKPKIYYLSSIQDENDIEKTNLSYLKALEQNQKKDLDFKTTLIGPHRDDFSINFSGKAAKSFASEGQKKILLYAIRFAEWELLHSKYEQKPPFLIDDFDAHLDEKHKKNLKQAFKKFSQVFITMPKTTESFENAHFINLKDQMFK
ncbi:hypothetical protein LCGC14_1654240, partial [marine sediment metagenome]